MTSSCDTPFDGKWLRDIESVLYWITQWNLQLILTYHIIKSPQYTGVDFMFLYRFVRRRRRRHRRRRRPQILVHAITFEELFGFLPFWQNCGPWPIVDLIRFWSIFVMTLSLNFPGQIWNLLYLSRKCADCFDSKSKYIDWTLGLKWDHRVWP